MKTIYKNTKNTRIPNAIIQIWYSALRHPFWLLLVAFLSIAAKATFWLRDAATKIILMTLCGNQLHIRSWHPQQVGWSCFLIHIQLHFNIIVFVFHQKYKTKIGGGETWPFDDIYIRTLIMIVAVNSRKPFFPRYWGWWCSWWHQQAFLRMMRAKAASSSKACLSLSPPPAMPSGQRPIYSDFLDNHFMDLFSAPQHPHL